MTTERTVTEQQKREALARWEGWTRGIIPAHLFGYPARPRMVPETLGWVPPEPKRRTERQPPDYSHAGTAMLRLLNEVRARGWTTALLAFSDHWEFSVYRSTGRLYTGSSESFPTAVAEAVYEAIQDD